NDDGRHCPGSCGGLIVGNRIDVAMTKLKRHWPSPPHESGLDQTPPCGFLLERGHALRAPWCRPIALLHAMRSRQYSAPPDESALHLSIEESLDTRGVRPRNPARDRVQQDHHYHRRP